MDPQNTHEKKFRTHEIPPRQQILDPQNTHEKKFGTLEIPTRKKIRTREITKRKNFVPMKEQWHETHDGTRPTEFSTLNITLLLNCVSSINLGKVNKHCVRKLTLIGA